LNAKKQAKADYKLALVEAGIEKQSFGTKVAKDFKRNWQLYLLMLIPLVYIFIFRYLPIAGNVIAFRRFRPGSSIYGEYWVGLRFFRGFISDQNFWRSFRNSLTIGVQSLVFAFPAPIILALLINEISRSRIKKIVQTISYMPHFLAIPVLVGIIFNLTSSTGLFNQIVYFMYNRGWTDQPSIVFMNQPEWFRPLFIGSRIWQSAGFGTIIYLASLSGIDPTLYEAAKVDGANRWKQTLHITLPGIKGTIVTLLILSIGGVLAVNFEQIQIMQNNLNMPASDVIATYVLRLGLDHAQFSLATAVGLFESLIGITLITSANFVSKKLTERSLW